MRRSLFVLTALLTACGGNMTPDSGTGGGSSTGGGAATGGGSNATGGGSATGGGTSTGGGSATGGGAAGWTPLWDGGAAADAGDFTTFSVPDEFGQRFEGVCPPGGTEGSVWGTDLYTSDSDVCTAGQHMGLITLLAGGTLTIESRPGDDFYEGTTRNDITSSNYGTYSASYGFVGSNGQLIGNPNRTPPAPDAGPSQWDGGMVIDLGTLTWSDSAVQFRGEHGQRYSLTCPSGGEEATIWGTGLYTDDSAMCVAGMHSGKFDFDGGVMTIEIYPGSVSYVGSTANGISSNDYASYTGSYLVLP